MDKEQAITLVEYNKWANHRVLTKAAHLSPDELHRETILSHRTIMSTLVHILDSQWYWREGAQTGKLPTQTITVEDFSGLLALRRAYPRSASKPAWKQVLRKSGAAIQNWGRKPESFPGV